MRGTLPVRFFSFPTKFCAASDFAEPDEDPERFWRSEWSGKDRTTLLRMIWKRHNLLRIVWKRYKMLRNFWKLPHTMLVRMIWKGTNKVSQNDLERNIQLCSEWSGKEHTTMLRMIWKNKSTLLWSIWKNSTMVPRTIWKIAWCFSEWSGQEGKTLLKINKAAKNNLR